MKVLMLVASSVVHDTRVQREATALTDAGHAVTIIGKDTPPGLSLGQPAVLSAAGGRGLAAVGSALRLSAGRPGGGLPYAALRWLALPQHRRLVWRRWAAEVARAAGLLEFDLVHVHDFTALSVGRRLARERGVPFVYDSHELWSGRLRAGRPEPLLRRWDLALERHWGSQAAAVVTVGEGLAERLQALFGWPVVHVVRNTFPRQPDATTVMRPRQLVYAGRLGPDRDLETVAAASNLTRIPIRLVGPADTNWLGGFIRGRCTVDPPLDPGSVMSALQSAGLALVPLTNSCENHRLALPNKLLQAVSAGVPVVAADVGELARTVKSWGVGVLYRPGAAPSLAAAMAEASERYEELRSAIRLAASSADWEIDRRRLLAAYGDIGVCQSASGTGHGR